VSERIVPIAVNRILVALDGSDHSKKAAELAVDIAKKWSAEVNLIHVREEKNIPKGFKEYAEAERIPASNYFAMVCERDQFLGEAENRLREAGVKVAEPICVFGDPADRIIKEAKRVKADLIVMGSRGLGRFSKVFMGSVSTKVCNHAHCTCITVK